MIYAGVPDGSSQLKSVTRFLPRPLSPHSFGGCRAMIDADDRVYAVCTHVFVDIGHTA